MKVSISEQSAPASVSAETAICVFRVVQEALANVRKHSHARHVSIRISERKGILIVRVADDGVGLSANELQHQNGLGLGNMKERALGVGGTLTISSSPGRGTRVELRIPMPGSRS